MPCLLISSMAVLGFTLPPDSGEKLSLGKGCPLNRVENGNLDAIVSLDWEHEPLSSPVNKGLSAHDRL